MPSFFLDDYNGNKGFMTLSIRFSACERKTKLSYNGCGEDFSGKCDFRAVIPSKFCTNFVPYGIYLGESGEHSFKNSSVQITVL